MFVQRGVVGNESDVLTDRASERELVAAVLLERAVPIHVILAERRHDHHSRRQIKVDHLEARYFEDDPALTVSSAAS